MSEADNLSDQLNRAIGSKNVAKFQSILDEQNGNLVDCLKPRVINEILLKCVSLPPSNGTEAHGAKFIEVFMLKLHTFKCYFGFSDDTCKTVVRSYISQNHQFSPYSIQLLLRCHDLELVKRVFNQNLIDDQCSSDCSNWHLMFVASYQERFFTNYLDTILEGFLSRFVLICKLRCSLSQKRFFLTWFAGSLHLYTDEYFLQNEESRFKYVLVKLFESLILNGLLSYSDFTNLSKMLATRTQELTQINSAKQYSSIVFPSRGGNVASCSSSSSSAGDYFPSLKALFPLSLKNNCRLAVKNSMVKFKQNEIEKLPLPLNLKKFVFFDHECESVFKCFDQIKR